MKHGKKYNQGAQLVDRAALYEPSEALDIAVKTATAKFDETVEVHIRLGVDSRHADQQVRGAVVLPNGTGKKVRVAVFAKGDAAKAAQAAGAEFVGDADLVAEVQGGMMDFDVCIASPDMMGLVGRLGKVLGPRGLCENFNTLMDAIVKAKPAEMKGQYIKSCVVATTMGPGVKINANKFGTAVVAE